MLFRQKLTWQTIQMYIFLQYHAVEYQPEKKNHEMVTGNWKFLIKLLFEIL